MCRSYAYCCNFCKFYVYQPVVSGKHYWSHLPHLDLTMFLFHIGHKAMRLTKKLLAIGSYWLLGEGKSVFFNGFTLCTLDTLQGRTCDWTPYFFFGNFWCIFCFCFVFSVFFCLFCFSLREKAWNWVDRGESGDVKNVT